MLSEKQLPQFRRLVISKSQAKPCIFHHQIKTNLVSVLSEHYTSGNTIVNLN